MIVIDPKYRRTIEIDGEKWTLRPLTWADQMTISEAKGMDRWRVLLGLSVVEHPPLVDVDGNALAFNVDALPMHVITRLMQVSDEISKVAEPTAKNSSSPEPCSPDSGKATTLDASNESDSRTTAFDGTSQPSQTMQSAESQVS